MSQDALSIQQAQINRWCQFSNGRGCRRRSLARAYRGYRCALSGMSMRPGHGRQLTFSAFRAPGTGDR